MTAGIAEVRVILKSIESLPNSFESLEDEIKEDKEIKTTDSSFEIVSDLLTGKILKIVHTIFIFFFELDS